MTTYLGVLEAALHHLAEAGDGLVFAGDGETGLDHARVEHRDKHGVKYPEKQKKSQAISFLERVSFFNERFGCVLIQHYRNQERGHSV